jgi:hypothetical protein
MKSKKAFFLINKIFYNNPYNIFSISTIGCEILNSKNEEKRRIVNA